MKKLLSITLALSLALTSLFTLVGCGGGGEKPDPNRTQIYVSVQECGLGNTFLDSLKTKYEALHPEIQIMRITNGENNDGVIAEIQNGGHDVYMFTHCNIANFTNVNNKTSDLFADISDIVTADGENSIHNRLFDSVKGYYNLGTEETPSYFVLPWFSSYKGTVYDVDLFEERHYFSTDPESELYYEGYDGESGTADDNWGPDGREDTFDDGLPATIGDFMQLINTMRMVDDQGKWVMPFCWTSFDGYSAGWLNGLWAAYEGQNYMLMTDFDGTYYSTNAEPLVIDNTNGYLTALQNGKAAALKFGEWIVNGGHYLPLSATAMDNEETQATYLESVVNDSPTAPRIAFMIEGTWWENEAKATFKEMENTDDEKYAYGTRKFGYLPFPRFVGAGCDELGVPEQWNTKLSIMGGDVGSIGSAVAINKKSKVVAEAKEFVKFAYSEAMCADFTIESGVSKPLQYDMSGRYGDMTHYQKSVYEITQLSKDENSNVEVISGLNRSKHIRTNPSFIEDIVGFTASRTKGSSSTVSDPFTVFIQQTLTASQYIENVEDYITKAKWDNAFSSLN